MNIRNLQKITFLIISAFAGDFIQADVSQPAQQKILTLGYGNLQFTAPEPGSYCLPIMITLIAALVMPKPWVKKTKHNECRLLPAFMLIRSCADYNCCRNKNLTISAAMK
jgi:hypothetical protein